MPENKAEVVSLESGSVSMKSDSGEMLVLPLSFFGAVPAIGEQFLIHVSDVSGGKGALARQILNEVLHLGDKA